MYKAEHTNGLSNNQKIFIKCMIAFHCCRYKKLN